MRAGELVTVGEGDSTEIDGLALFGSLGADFLTALRRPRGGALLIDAGAFSAVPVLVIFEEGALALAVFLVQAIRQTIKLIQTELNWPQNLFFPTFKTNVPRLVSNEGWLKSLLLLYKWLI